MTCIQSGGAAGLEATRKPAEAGCESSVVWVDLPGYSAAVRCAGFHRLLRRVSRSHHAQAVVERGDEPDRESDRGHSESHENGYPDHRSSAEARHQIRAPSEKSSWRSMASQESQKSLWSFLPRSGNVLGKTGVVEMGRMSFVLSEAGFMAEISRLSVKEKRRLIRLLRADLLSLTGQEPEVDRASTSERRGKSLEVPNPLA